MAGTYEYLLSHVPIRLAPEAPDLYEPLTLSWLRRTTGTTMPPGPAATFYRAEWLLGFRGLEYSTNIEWASHMPWLVSEMEPWQVTHRSRDVAMSAPQLQPAELDHRLEVVKASVNEYKRRGITAHQSHQLYELVLHTTRKYLQLNMDWISSYIKEHKSSSMGEGMLWNGAYSMTASQWTDILSLQKENIDAMLRHSGWQCTNQLFTGIRARPNSLTSFTDHTSGEITRSRIIGFEPSRSTWTVFIPQKAAWYEEILREAEQILHVQGEIHYPYVEGGKIYLTFLDQFNKGRPYKPHDGKAWEASIGMILGSDFNPFLFKTKGIMQLPSGITVTSLLDTLASVVTIRQHKGVFLILGDDVNYFGHETIATPYEEYQPMDAKTEYFLGIVRQPDPKRPRITGVKVTMDNAKKRVRLPVTDEPQQQEYDYARGLQQRVAHAGLYRGWFGETSLIEALSKTKPSEFVSPGEKFEQMIEDVTTGKVALSWAETEGVLHYFTD